MPWHSHFFTFELKERRNQLKIEIFAKISKLGDKREENNIQDFLLKRQS